MHTTLKSILTLWNWTWTHRQEWHARTNFHFLNLTLNHFAYFGHGFLINLFKYFVQLGASTAVRIAQILSVSSLGRSIQIWSVLNSFCVKFHRVYVECWSGLQIRSDPFTNCKVCSLHNFVRRSFVQPDCFRFMACVLHDSLLIHSCLIEPGRSSQSKRMVSEMPFEFGLFCKPFHSGFESVDTHWIFRIPSGGCLTMFGDWVHIQT